MNASPYIRVSIIIRFYDIVYTCYWLYDPPKITLEIKLTDPDMD